MFSTILYELMIKRRAFLGWAIVMFFWVALVAWAWGAIEERGLQEMYERLVEEYPEEFIKLFAKGVPVAFNADAFYVFEYFVIVVVIAFGAYVAYISAGSVVDDVLDKVGALNLSLPVPRWRLLLSRIIANIMLATIVLALSLAVSIALLVIAVDRPLTLENVILLHLMGILYAASLAGLGALIATILPITLAKPAAAGVVLAMYVLDSMTVNTSLESLGYLTLTRYYPVLEIATQGTVEIADAAALALATVIFTVAAMILYRRKDMPV